MADVVRVVEMEHVGGFEFRVRFGPAMQELVMDEAPPLGNDAGPGASSVLGAAIANCLTASLLLCLNKSHVALKGMRTRVEVTTGRNDKGRMRVHGANARIQLDLGGEDPARLARCVSLFEDYCTVSASIRQGIPIDVTVIDEAGNELHKGEVATVAT